MQILIQACACAGREKLFKNWCLGTFAPRLLRRSRAIQRLIVNVAIPPPAAQPYGQAEALEGDDFDVILQVWVPDLPSMVDAWRPLADAFAAWTRVAHVYRVTDTEVLYRPALMAGTPSPGIKLMRGLFLFDDLPDVAAQRIWHHHASLAVRVHVGLGRYARHWVDEVLTPGSPKVRGFSDLHFPDEASMRERYFDSQRGREQVLHDVGNFICGGTKRFYAREHILR